MDAVWIALTIFLLAIAAGLTLVLVRLAGTIVELTSLVRGLERELLPVINETGGTIVRVNAQLDKADVVTTSAVDAADSVDTAVRALTIALVRPVQKISALSEGIAQRRGRYGAYLHRDRVNRKLRPRKGARLTAITCGGAIPEIADYRVVIDDENRTLVGTLDEDFAIESNSGDIFLLGNTSWRIKHVRGGEVVVTDAHGAPPTIPFWLGEAPRHREDRPCSRLPSAVPARPPPRCRAATEPY